jgi:hypothetical protein
MVGIADALYACLGPEVAAAEAGCAERGRGKGDAEAVDRF